MLKALSHLVITSHQVPHMTQFFAEAFKVEPHFQNEEFSDFVLPDKSRVAFFKPVGKAKDFFDVVESPSQVSYGVTVENVDQLYTDLLILQKKFSLSFSGQPKEHPWGEKSFLLIDPDKNRWEITQSPSEEGHLINR
jgi:hypothetical protein